MEVISVVACILSILGKICVNYKSRANFALFMAGYMLWLVYYACTTPNIPQMVMYAVYAALSVHGWVKWKEEQHASKESKRRVSVREERKSIQEQSQS